MNTTLLMAYLIIDLIICFGIPIGYLVYLAVKDRIRVKPYFVGVAVFTTAQLLIRIPIIQHILPSMSWYIYLSVFCPVLYALFLGITAGLFEEVGRFLGFKLLLKKHRGFKDAIAFGMGHGGIEAMTISGLMAIKNIAMLLAIKSGNFDSSRFGVNENAVKAAFQANGGIEVLFLGLERIGAISIHVGLSLMVLYGVYKGKKIYIFLAIAIHAVIDTAIGIFPLLSLRGNAVYISEIWCAVWAALLLMFVIRSRKLFEKE